MRSRSKHLRGQGVLKTAPGRARWGVALVALVAACGSSGTTLSSSSGTTGAATTGGEASSGGTGGGGGSGVTVAPAVTIGWHDLSAKLGLAGLESRCATVSLADLDGDGAPDLVLPDTGEVRLYRNDGAGHFALWSTVPVPKIAPLETICATAIADLDGDGRRDVVVGLDHNALSTGVAVLFNDGAGAFTAVEAELPQTGLEFMSGVTPGLSIFSIAVAQAAGHPTMILVGNNVDGAAGMVDMATCTYDERAINVECTTPILAPSSTAFRVPTGMRTLEPVTDAVLTTKGNAQAFGASDFDGDGDDDLLVAVDFLPQRALRSQGATFTNASTAWGIDHFGHGMGVALGDIDDDGVTDAVISTLGGFLDFKGHGAAGFELRDTVSPYETRRRSIWPFSTLFVDLDNNGHLDLLAINEFASTKPDPLQWMLQLGGPADYLGAFNTVIYKDSDTEYREAHVPYAAQLSGHGRGRSVAVADLDGDGHLELAMLLVRASDKTKTDLVVGQLSGGTLGHGLTVRLDARAGQGTRVTLTCGGRKQMREIYGAEGMGAAARTDAHFGCGAATTYEALRVEPRGHEAIDLPGGQLDTAVFVKVP
ncbi:MAG: CRTAC1 family protein [Byssovorax sp.]